MIITKTPLRISFFGGGTDFPAFFQKHGGAVLSTAIDKYIYVIVKQRWDSGIYCHYSRNEVVDHVDDIKHDLIRESLKWCGITDGVEIVTLADIPSQGSGLGSSSSLTVGLLNALHNYCGFLPYRLLLARGACEVEIKMCGKGIGWQDQHIAAFGGFQSIAWPKDSAMTMDDVPISESDLESLERNLMLFYTGQTRSADSVLSEQNSRIDQNTEMLLVMKDMVKESCRLLQLGRLDDFGQMLGQSWEFKRRLTDRISNPEIDFMYQAALNAGAIGGKLCGAGGGGFMLIYCRPHRQEAVRLALSDYRELPFRFEKEGSKVIVNGSNGHDQELCQCNGQECRAAALCCD